MGRCNQNGDLSEWSKEIDLNTYFRSIGASRVGSNPAVIDISFCIVPFEREKFRGEEISLDMHVLIVPV